MRQVYKTERDFLSCSAQRLMRRDSSGTPSLKYIKDIGHGKRFQPSDTGFAISTIFILIGTINH